MTFVSELSHNIDVWLLVQELNWIGESGKASFHEECNNVTKQLQGNETFDANMLHSLEVAVFYFSEVVFLKVNDCSMKDFLDCLQNNEELNDSHNNRKFQELKLFKLTQ